MHVDPLASCESLLQAMVGFDTVNSRISGRPDAEVELSRFLESSALAEGLDTFRFPMGGQGFNLLVTAPPAEGRPWILFESHLDTVSTEGMTIDPFAGEVREGKLYGRGAADTKGSGAAMFWALKRFGEAGDRPNNAAVVFTLSEEVGKDGVKAFVQDHLRELPWRPRGVIVGEPTQLAMVVAHNGVVRWPIRTHGVAAHSSDPTRGKSAIAMMVKVIEAIESKYIAELSTSHALTGPARCSINLIQGGVQINIIPETCEIRLDRRVVPGEDPTAVLPAVQRVLEELRRSEPELVVSQGDPFLDPPLDPAGNEGFAGIVRGVLARRGMPAEPQGVGFGTDASTFCEAGVPAIVLGPGNIAQAHTCDEWIELDQLSGAVEVYLDLMRTPLTGSA